MSTCLQRRKGLPPVSKKKLRKDAEWKLTRDRILDAYPFCQAPALYTKALATTHLDQAETDILSRALGRCSGRSYDVHHVLQRSLGGTDSDDSLLLACCRRCHDLAHSEIDLAHKIGTLVRSWEVAR